MTQSAVGQSAATRARRTGPAPGQHGASWWRVSWSAAAALRALRAVIVIPSLFALTFKVIADPQMTLFAVFGGFGTLVMTSFGGDRKDKALAHLGLAVAGSITLTIGTMVSGSTWLAVVVTIPVAFAIYFAGSTGPNAASGVTACLLAYVLPVASAASPSTLPSRLEGWWLASAVGTAAVLLASPALPGDRLRAQAAALATACASYLRAAVQGSAAAPDLAAVGQAKRALMDTFVATPNRSSGPAAAEHALASLVHLLEWCASQLADTGSQRDLAAAGPAERSLLAASADALEQVGAVLSGQADSASAAPVRAARLASARHLRTLTGAPQAIVASADEAFHAQEIGVAVSAAVGDALIAARLATPAEVAAERQNWLRDEEGGTVPARSPQPEPCGWRAAVANIVGRSTGVLATDATLRSVLFRNSARGAIALAVAVAVARLTNVEHGFWVLLGTLSVLRTNAAATGATAVRALVGTAAGFVVGAALLVGIGTSPVALWIALPVAVLAAAYAPGAAPFVVGQAAFTVMVVVLFNLLAPAGWRVGLLRVEDVAIGAAVSLVIGTLFWPRGTSAVVGDNLADAFRRGADYLTVAVNWALGESPHRPESAMAALTAGNRVDDAMRAYATEQGSKRMPKDELWTLVTGAMRLRLTAHSLASLPGSRPRPQEERVDSALHQRVAELAGFYAVVAALVARPSRASPAPTQIHVPSAPTEASLAAATAEDPGALQPDVLWVGHHLDQLAAHCAAMTGPAKRLAAIRRRPWWR